LDKFLIVIRLVLNYIYFSFNGKFYKQILISYGIHSVSSSVSYPKDLKTLIIERSPTQLLFYFRYKDDIILAALGDALNEI